MKDKSKEPTKVYVCSPHRPVSADQEERKLEIATNRKRVINACKLLTICGYLPMAPHLYFTQFLSDDAPEQREEGM
ncbi:MAG: hypothetical protein LUD77_02305 [Clostridiales bacterium]|nr:hypothetical protein [Clostridiales bacterium]